MKEIILKANKELKDLQKYKIEQNKIHQNLPYSEEDSIINSKYFFYFYHQVTKHVDLFASFFYTAHPKNNNFRIFEASANECMIYIRYVPTEESSWTYQSLWKDLITYGTTLEEAINNQASHK